MVCDDAIEACGFCLPSTSNPNGKTKALKDGEYVIVPPFNKDKQTPGVTNFDFYYGYVNERMSHHVINKIKQNKKKT